VGGTAKVRAAAAALALLAAVAAGASGCSDGGHQGAHRGSGHGSGGAQRNGSGPTGKRGAAVHVDRADALADRKVHIRIDGLRPHQAVTVESHATDHTGAPWGARGRYRADAHGAVDLDRQAPRGGRPYRGADSMGLLTAMLPHGGPSARQVGSGKAFSYHPGSLARHRTFQVELAVRDGGGHRLGERSLTRRWLARGVRTRRLTVRKDRLDGRLFVPSAAVRGGKRRAPVLVFGGSEGGHAGEYAAALLASHGHPAISLCYFKCGRGSQRPGAINMIDLGYFTRAVKTLDEQPGADARRAAVMGNSRGSEPAQLLGQRHPRLVRNVLAYAPSAQVNGPYLAGTSGRAAWAEHGRPIPAGPIRLNRVSGIVLAVAGSNDKMWGSARAAGVIAGQHNAHGHPHRRLTYAGAGHHVNWFPYGQPGQDGGADGRTAATSRADQAARQQGWPQVLRLLDH